MPDFTGPFELLVYGDGGWRPLKQFERREDAVVEAQALDETQRYKSVKVVVDEFDRASRLFISKTVFRGTPLIDESLVKQRRAELRVKRILERNEARKRARERLKARRREKLKALLFPLGLTARLLLIVVGGIWLLFALRDHLQ